MIKLPTPVDETLINSVMDDLEFFTKGQMLYFERGQLFQTDNVSTHAPATNTAKPGKYANLHPQYDPANLVPQNIFRAGQTANPHEIDFRGLKENSSKVYFTMLGSTQKPSWLLSLPTNVLIYNPTTNSMQYIKPKEFSLKGKDAVITKEGNETKYPLVVEENGDVDQVLGFLKKAITAQPTKTFELFFSSFAAIDAYPPIQHQMISFYRSVVENIQFLFLFSTYKKSCTQQIVSAWMEAAGHNIITLIPITLYNYFKTLPEANAVFRSDSFITALLVKIIEKDQGFLDFLDSMDMQADDLNEEFFTKFERCKFKPLSAFLLHHVFVEGRRAYPNKNAEYYGISGLLFLRIMTPQLSTKYPSMSMRLAALNSLYNMTESKVGIEKVKRMKDLLDQFETFPDEFGMEKTPSTSEASITTLIKCVAENSTAFMNIAKTTDIVQIANGYYQATTGKAPPADKPQKKQKTPNYDMSDPDSYSDLQSEISKSSNSDI